MTIVDEFGEAPLPWWRSDECAATPPTPPAEAHGEAICDLFPDAGRGGVGDATARQNARLIIEARARSAP